MPRLDKRYKLIGGGGSLIMPLGEFADLDFEAGAQNVYLVNTVTGGNVTATLASQSEGEGGVSGQVIYIKNIGTGRVTVVPQATQSIDGVVDLNVFLGPGESVLLYGFSAFSPSWWQIAGFDEAAFVPVSMSLGSAVNYDARYREFVIVDATDLGAPATVTLPLATDGPGQEIGIRNLSTSVGTIDVTLQGPDVLEPAATFNIAIGETRRYVADSANNRWVESA
jgi:hypothetical protein